MKPKKRQIVEIGWTDTASDHEGWQPRDSEKAKPLTPTMYTVGYLMVKTKLFIQLCQSLAPQFDHTAERITIPAGCILSVKEL